VVNVIKLIIAGPRSCTRNVAIFNQIRQYIEELGGADEIVSGGSTGIDMMAKQYAYEHQISYKEFIPNWQDDLNAAGIVRDLRMAEYGTHLLVFRSGSSKESEHLIHQAEHNHLIIRIIEASDRKTAATGTATT